MCRQQCLDTGDFVSYVVFGGTGGGLGGVVWWVEYRSWLNRDSRFFSLWCGMTQEQGCVYCCHRGLTFVVVGDEQDEMQIKKLFFKSNKYQAHAQVAPQLFLGIPFLWTDKSTLPLPLTFLLVWLLAILHERRYTPVLV